MKKFNYDEFKKEICNNKAFGDYETEIVTVHKNNGKVEAIRFVKEGEASAPVFYLKSLYEGYLENGFECTLKKVEEQLEEAISNPLFENDILNNIVETKGFEGRVIPQVINKELNKEFLETVPHRDLKELDLSIIYRLNVTEDEQQIFASGIINHFTASKLGVSEKELFKESIKTLSLNFKPQLITIDTIIKSILFEECGLEEGDDPEMDKMIEKNLENDKNQMYVITNMARTFGANVLIDSKSLSRFANEIGDDLLILPSSIHEIIVLPANCKEKSTEGLKEMVQSVNATEVSADEVLSNNVYYFERATQSVSMVG